MSDTSLFVNFADGLPHRCCVFLPINDDEFLAVPTEEDGVIHKYNVSTNQWNRILQLSGLDDCCGIFDADYDPLTHCLYLVTRRNMAAVNFNCGTVRVLGITDCDILSGPRLLINGDDLHLFGCFEEYVLQIHFIANKNNFFLIPGDHLLVEGVGKPRECEMLIEDKYLFSDSRNSILVIGRGSTRGKQSATMICEYSLETKQWINFEWLKELECNYTVGTDTVITKDGRYIITIGTVNIYADPKTTGRIAVWDLTQKKYAVSKLECPIPGSVIAVVMKNIKTDELVKQGFVNQSCKELGFKDATVIPQHLIQMICEYACNEYIHVFPVFPVTSKDHLRIRVDDIVANTF